MAELKEKIPLRKSPIWPALLSALVVPGMGQVFNRDYKKGFFLMAVFFGSFMWFSKVVTEQLSGILTGTPDQWAQNPSMLQEGVMKLVTQNTDMFFTFQLLIIIVWIFAIVDAYLVARRNAANPVTPTDDETDHSID